MPREIMSDGYLRKNCAGAVLYKEFEDLDHNVYPPNKIANPCGLMAKFFPQDTFESIEALPDKLPSIKHRPMQATKSYDILVNQIADPGFAKRFHKNLKELQWTDIEDPRFINWMVGLQEDQVALQLSQALGSHQCRLYASWRVQSPNIKRLAH